MLYQTSRVIEFPPARFIPEVHDTVQNLNGESNNGIPAMPLNERCSTVFDDDLGQQADTPEQHSPSAPNHDTSIPSICSDQDNDLLLGLSAQGM